MTAGKLKSPSVVWNNDFSAETRAPKPSFVVAVADVVGDGDPLSACSGRADLLPFGAIIDLIDLCSGRCCYAHHEGAVVTVSVDHGVMTAPLRRGSLVRVEARVVLVGSSSITIEARTLCEELRGPGPPHFVPCVTSMLTFVAIDVATKRPLKRVPPLLTEGDADAVARAKKAIDAKARIHAMNSVLAEIDAAELPPSPPADPFEANRIRRVRLCDTAVELRKQYLPRHENFGGVVFGGDLMLTLEKAAVYAVVRHTSHRHVACVALYSVHFALPVKPMYLLKTTARVVWVRQYCMEVEVVARVDRTHEGLGANDIALTGCFTVVAHDEDGRALLATVGLDMTKADDEELRTHAKAKIRMESAELFQEDEALVELLTRRTLY
jgi:acyl-CoA hydrolase